MRKRPGYHSVSVTDVTYSDDELPDKNTDAQITKKHKPKTFCQYLCTNILSKGPLLYFLIGIIASIANAVYYLMDNDSGFVISGVLGLSLCFYGIKHFYTLLGLKKTVDRFSQLNLDFHRERTKISKSVNSISHARQNLQDTQKRLQAANAQNRENLDNFREIQTNMETFGKESVEELTNVHKKSDVIEKRWRKSLFEHERDILYTVFERMERQGSRLGMNMEEFKEFTSQLPSAYKRRFDRLGTFHKLSKGGSLMRYDDFKVSLDLFAEMKVDNVDIEFEIRKTKKKKPIKGMASLGINLKLNALTESDSERERKSWRHNGIDIKTIDLTKMNEAEKAQSIDLEDVEFDEDEANAPALYDRSIVITKRTVNGGQMKDDLALFDDTDSDSDEDDDDAARLFRREEALRGKEIRKPSIKVTEIENVGLKSLGVRQFTDLLDDVDD